MQDETKVSDSKVAVEETCLRPEFNLPEFKTEKEQTFTKCPLISTCSGADMSMCRHTHISKPINTSSKRQHSKQNQLIIISYIFLADFIKFYISFNDILLCSYHF